MRNKKKIIQKYRRFGECGWTKQNLYREDDVIAAMQEYAEQENAELKEDADRQRILLQATLDILNKCNEGMYVKNVMEVTAIWDEAECDGYCLRDEIEEILNK